MGLFNKKKENEVEKKSSKKDKKNVKPIKKAVKKNNKKDAPVIPAENTEMAYRFILHPWITEKTQELMSANKYVFKLRPKTTKSQIKVAVEKLYSVKIAKINIINIPQKKRRFGKVIGKKSAIRKAIVTLVKGHKIEVFE